MQIDISFQNWQRLTALLESERDTIDNVIARLIADRLAQSRELSIVRRGASELAVKGVTLPNGTMLRATFKGKTYFAEIIEGRWFDRETGERRNSPSQAAIAITGGVTNGWRFWQVRRPGDDDWCALADLRPPAAARRAAAA
jgi:hypothetical protein